MSVTLHVPVQISDEDFVDLVLYSGFDTFSWWRSVSYDETNRRVTLTADDPSDDELTVDFQVGLDELAKAADETGKTNPGLFERLANLDIDADDADAIVQTAVFGEIVYG